MLGTTDQFVDQQMLVKMSQCFVANFTNRLTIRCNLRLDLTHFNVASE